MAHRRTTPLNESHFDGAHCTVDVRLDKLGRVPFFEDLTEEELRQVHKKFNATHYSEGETMYFQGERATLLRVIAKGNVKTFRQTLEGKNVLLEMLEPGEFFGSLSALGDKEYKETAEAQTNSCILAIGLKEFRSVINEYPVVAVSLLNITAERLTSSQDKIRQLTTLSVKQRIAKILLSLADKFGEDSRYGLLIQLPLSRKDLANMVGTSPETASRIMSRFQEDETIETGRQWVAILDRKQLQQTSQE